MIIVLTMGRSGSSLLMQTLDALGCEVIGRKFDDHADADRAKMHRSLNPGGYFEEPDIYHGGPRSDAFKRLLEDRPHRCACKMDLRHLADPAQLEAWLAAASHITALLISFRDPSEQAQSEYLTTDLARADTDQQTKFVFVTNFLRNYRLNYGQILALEKGPLSVVVPKTFIVDFAEIQLPSSYVDRIARLCSLSPSNEQTAAAAAHIDSRLMRVKSQDIDTVQKEWAVNLGASDVYDALKTVRRRGA